VGKVLLIQHGRRDIWDIAASITLPGHIDFEVFDAKDFLKILEEFHKVFGNFFLSRCRWGADRVSGSNRLFNPV
jgi:hypothetical protein